MDVSIHRFDGSIKFRQSDSNPGIGWLEIQTVEYQPRFGEISIFVHDKEHQLALAIKLETAARQIREHINVPGGNQIERPAEQYQGDRDTSGDHNREFVPQDTNRQMRSSSSS